MNKPNAHLFHQSVEVHQIRVVLCQGHPVDDPALRTLVFPVVVVAGAESAQTFVVVVLVAVSVYVIVVVGVVGETVPGLLFLLAKQLRLEEGRVARLRLPGRRQLVVPVVLWPIGPGNKHGKPFLYKRFAYRTYRTFSFCKDLIIMPLTRAAEGFLK